MAKKKTGHDRSLRRLGGGRWQTRDERFTIEPESGTWVLVDASQTDELGLPLVRGPFRSLTKAKEAIEAARAAGPPKSPLADRVSEVRSRPDQRDPPATRPERGPEAAPKPKPEPPWIADLPPAGRRRARDLIDALATAGVADAEGLVRRDLVGGVPTIARHAVVNRIAQVLDTFRARADGEAVPLDLVEELVGLLGEGRDADLGVRWRLVDDDGRPIDLGQRDLRSALERD